MSNEIVLLRRVEELEKLIMRQPEVGGVWQDWTPTWSAQTTNVSLGDGTLTGRYCVIGKVCHLKINLTAGSTTTFGAGIWRFNKPIASANTNGNGIVRMLDSSEPAASSTKFAFCYHVNTNLLYLRGVAGDQIDFDYPFAWASGDTLDLTIAYEI